jgi:hypothetical protein
MSDIQRIGEDGEKYIGKGSERHGLLEHVWLQLREVVILIKEFQSFTGCNDNIKG